MHASKVALASETCFSTAMVKPVGISGLIMAAILAAAMSNLSAALNALASTTIMDFYKVLRPNRTESHFLKMARYATVVWGVVLVAEGTRRPRWSMGA